MDNIHNEILEELNNYNVSFTDNISQIISLGNEFKTPIEKINNDFNKVGNALRVCHINPTSVLPHRDEICRIALGTDMDVIFISESNMKQSTLRSRISLPGYKLFRKDRTHAGRGGVAIYIKDHLVAKKINLKYQDIAPELLCIEAVINRTKIFLAVLYKPPGAKYDVLDNVLEELAFLTTKYDHTILAGDFNINLLKTEKPAYRFLMNAFIQPLQLTQVIKDPTFLKENSESLIDLMLVTSPNDVRVSGVTDFLGINQHCLIYMAYGIQRQRCKPQVVKRRDFRNFSEPDFRQDMENAPWGNIYSAEERDLDMQVNILENIYANIIDKHAPMREIKIRKPVPTQWMNDEIIQAMDLRDKHKAKYNKYKDSLMLDEYKRLKNHVNSLVRKAKIRDFNERVNSKVKNAKLFHLALKMCAVVDVKKRENGEVNLDADKLNKFFTTHNNAEVDADMIEQEVTRILSMSSPFSLRFREVTELEVKKIVKSFKSNSAGIDGINTIFIKKSIDFSIHALTEIINCSIKWSSFPKRWKKALVVPIPKCDDPTSEKDYRPISLLPIFSKVLEKVIAIQLIEYFINTSLYDKFQSAYKRFHSTGTALLYIMDQLLQSIDQGNIVIMALLDYSKAFDTANHQLIIAKLKSLGLTDTACNWISSYLSKRTQKVITNKGVSTEIQLKNGVPQGSILGPILFTVLTSDLHKCIEYCNYHCYADDTQIYLSGQVTEITDIIRRLNADLNSISNFSRINCLKLNYDKNKFIIYGSKVNLNKLSRMDLDPILIDGEIVKRERVVKNLGLYMDEELNFEHHINHITQKAFGKLKTAWKCGKFLTQDSKHIIAECYVLSQFNYCDVVWRTITKTIWTKIQKIQNNCVRFIFKLRKYDHISIEFSELNTLNMTNRSILHALTLMFKCINYKAPAYLTEKIEYVRNTHDYNTRGSVEIKCSQFNSRYGQMNFFNKISSVYNRLMQKIFIKPNCSIATFKKTVKNYLLTHQKNNTDHGLN